MSKFHVINNMEMRASLCSICVSSHTVKRNHNFRKANQKHTLEIQQLSDELFEV